MLHIDDRDTGKNVQTALVFEFLFLFVVLPVVFAVYPPAWPAMPVLWALTLYCYLVLRRQPDFNSREFWGLSIPGTWKRSILALFLPAACVLALAVYAVVPKMFLSLPMRQPVAWGLVMVLYPVLSVVPQTLVYRAFFFRRYRLLFPGEWSLIVASAVVFSWLHIVMRNPLAPLLTLPAGVLFAWRYARTHSVLTSAFEHALYGCLIFTVGLGRYFYMAAAR
jgi:CAAX protease family protein